jgi:hypothetical protein
VICPGICEQDMLQLQCQVNSMLPGIYEALVFDGGDMLGCNKLRSAAADCAAMT